MCVGIIGKDTQLPGVGNCLGPVGDVQLAIDTGRVGFDGAPGYDKLPGDLLVGPAQGYEMEHFQLTCCGVFMRSGWFEPPPATSAQAKDCYSFLFFHRNCKSWMKYQGGYAKECN